jgi:hypothetical protein
MTRPSAARLLALLTSATLVLACGSSNTSPSAGPSSAPPRTFAPTLGPTDQPSPTASGAADAVYDAIEAQVEELRGLPPVDVARETIDAETLAARSAEDFDKDNPADYVAANERLYKALGLLDEDQSLRDLFLDLVGSQVAGFYRPDEKKLFVVSRSGAVNGADKITFAHEYDHALQDANFDVFQDPEALRDQSDEALARAAVYEGDATLLMSLWALPNLTQQEVQDVVAAGNDPEANAILARTPDILTEDLLFPYNAGALFIQQFHQEGGWDAINDIFAELPVSTEQVMHPDKYVAREAPVQVAVPIDLASRLGSGWTSTLEDTWGEFQTAIWLRESGVPVADANAAAAGWGGDRLVVMGGPGGAWSVVMNSTWDTADDAAEFEAAATTAVTDGPYPGAVSADGQDVTIIIGSDQSVLDKTTDAVGAAGA